MCTADELTELCKHGVVMHKPARTVLVREGSIGDAFFVILHGTVDVSIKGTTVSKSGPGQFFGEASLLKNTPCSATVRVESSCLVLCYHRRAFQSLVSRIDSMRAGLSQFVERCTASNLRLFDLFTCLPDEHKDQWLETIASSLVFCTVNPGDVLYNAGDVQDTAFLISQVWWSRRRQ